MFVALFRASAAPENTHRPLSFTLSFPPPRDANEDVAGVSLTSVSELGGTANVIDGIIKTQNEFSGLECQPSTNQMTS